MWDTEKVDLFFQWNTAIEDSQSASNQQLNEDSVQVGMSEQNAQIKVTDYDGV